MIFEYTEKETQYLCKKDAKLALVIEKIGKVEREIDPDLFSSVVHQIAGQQISSKALSTIWTRFTDTLGTPNAQKILDLGIDNLQSLGISYRKAQYITDFAQKVNSGEFDLNEIALLSDEEAIAKLSSLKGIGIWTAEMILLFCLQRKNIFSFDDLAIQRGLRMVHHHRKINRTLFEKYRRRYSPYCSVASLYLWAVSGGAIPEMKDYAPKKSAKK